MNRPRIHDHSPVLFFLLMGFGTFGTICLAGPKTEEKKGCVSYLTEQIQALKKFCFGDSKNKPDSPCSIPLQDLTKETVNNYCRPLPKKAQKDPILEEGVKCLDQLFLELARKRQNTCEREAAGLLGAESNGPFPLTFLPQIHYRPEIPKFFRDKTQREMVLDKILGSQFLILKDILRRVAEHPHVTQYLFLEGIIEDNEFQSQKFTGTRNLGKKLFPQVPETLEDFSPEQKDYLAKYGVGRLLSSLDLENIVFKATEDLELNEKIDQMMEAQFKEGPDRFGGFLMHFVTTEREKVVKSRIESLVHELKNRAPSNPSGGPGEILLLFGAKHDFGRLFAHHPDLAYKKQPCLEMLALDFMNQFKRNARETSAPGPSRR